MRSGCAADQPDDHQQNHGADHRVDDLPYDRDRGSEAEFRQQEAADQGADNADRDIADQPKPESTHDLTRQPSGDRADDQHGNNASEFHDLPSRTGSER
jgi:hypothetical protein